MKNIFFVMILSQVSSLNAVSIYVSDVNSSWTNAANICEIAGPDDILNITISSDTFVWLNATLHFTTWTLYRGCLIFKTTTMYSINDIGRQHTKDPFLYCIKTCSSSKYFGLQETKCICLDTENRSNILSVCDPIPCPNDHNYLCGTPSENNFAIYKILNSTKLRGGAFNCLSVKPMTGKVSYQPTRCDKKLPLICREEASTQKELNWTYANKDCNDPKTTNNIKLLDVKKESWTAYTRSVEENRIPVKSPEYCVAAKVNRDGRIIKQTKKCDSNLPVLCKANENMESPLHIDDVDTRDQSPSSSDVTKEDRVNYTHLIYVSVGLLGLCIIVVSIIIGISCFRKRSNSAKSGVKGSKGQGDVYAVVQNQSRKLPKVEESSEIVVSNPSFSKTQEFPISSSTSEDVYDHTHYTLRQQLQEESNYDSMACLNSKFEECENVYNTANETKKFKIIVEDNSEYSHLGQLDEK